MQSRVIWTTPPRRNRDAVVQGEKHPAIAGLGLAEKRKADLWFQQALFADEGSTSDEGDHEYDPDYPSATRSHRTRKRPVSVWIMWNKLYSLRYSRACVNGLWTRV